MFSTSSSCTNNNINILCSLSRSRRRSSDEVKISPPSSYYSSAASLLVIASTVLMITTLLLFPLLVLLDSSSSSSSSSNSIISFVSAWDWPWEIDFTCDPGENPHCDFDFCGCRCCTAGKWCNGIIFWSCAPGKWSNECSAHCTECAPGTASPDEDTKHGCPQCLRGEYQPNSGTTHCGPTPPGTFANVTGMAKPHFCPVGHICPDRRMTDPRPCRAGYYMNDIGSSATECRICLPGSWSNEGAETCTPCRAGTFNNESRGASMDACIACDPGYSSFSGATNCTECKPGQWSTIRSGDCLPCAPGTASNEPRYPQECPACGRGWHQPLPGQTQCLECGKGEYTDEEGSQHCSRCRPGTYSDQVQRTTDCDVCPSGHITKEWGKTECTPCGAGFYTDAPGYSTCLPCAPGSASSEIGRESECAFCAPGNYSAVWNATSCKMCGKGQYQDEAGKTGCKSCPRGSKQDLIMQTSNSSCVLCPRGTYSPSEGSDVCLECPYGQYQDEEGKPSCKLCPAGTAVKRNGSISVNDCVWCDAGYYAATPGKAECDPCRPGSFVHTNITNKTECIICEPGMFAESPAAIKCEKCLAGTYSADVGATSSSTCRPCMRGTYASYNGSMNCQQCPSGLSSLPGATRCATVTLEISETDSIDRGLSETPSLDETESEELSSTDSLELSTTRSTTNSSSVADTPTRVRSDNTTTKSRSNSETDHADSTTKSKSVRTRTLSKSLNTPSDSAEITFTRINTPSSTLSDRSPSPSVSESLPPPCTGTAVLNISSSTRQSGRTFLATRRLIVDFRILPPKSGDDDDSSTTTPFFDMFIPNLSVENFTIDTNYPIQISRINFRQNRAVQLALTMDSDSLHIDAVVPMRIAIGIKVGGLSCQDPEDRPQQSVFRKSNDIELRLRYTDISAALVVGAKAAAAVSAMATALTGNPAAVRSGLAQQRSTSILLAMQCAADPSSTIDFLGNPLQMEIYGDDPSTGRAILRGTIIGNLIFNASLMVILLGLCIFTSHKHNRTKKGILNGRRPPEKFYSKNVLAYFMFPSYFFIILSILAQPTLTAAFGLFASPSAEQTSVDIFVGIIGVAIIFLPLWYYVQAVFPVEKKLDPYLVSEKLTVVWKDQMPREDWKRLKNDKQARIIDANKLSKTGLNFGDEDHLNQNDNNSKENSNNNNSNSSNMTNSYDDDNEFDDGGTELVDDMLGVNNKNNNNKSKKSSNSRKKNKNGKKEEEQEESALEESLLPNSKKNKNNNNNTKSNLSATSSSSGSSDEKKKGASAKKNGSNNDNGKKKIKFIPPKLPWSTRLYRWFYEARHPTEMWTSNTSPPSIGRNFLSCEGKVFDSMRRATVAFVIVDIGFSAILAVLLSLSPTPGTLLCRMNRYLLAIMVAMLFAVPIAFRPSNTPSENGFLIVIGFTLAIQLCVALFGLVGSDAGDEDLLTAGEYIDLFIMILCVLKVAIVDFWEPLRDQIFVPFIKFLGCIEIDATKSISEVKFERTEDEKVDGKKFIREGESVKKIFGDYRDAMAEGHEEDLVDEELWWGGDGALGYFGSNEEDDDYDEDADHNNKQEMKEFVSSSSKKQHATPPTTKSSSNNNVVKTQQQHHNNDDDEEYEEEYEEEEEEEDDNDNNDYYRPPSADSSSSQEEGEEVEVSTKNQKQRSKMVHHDPSI